KDLDHAARCTPVSVRMAFVARTGCGRNSVVECQLPKLDVAGSTPVARSREFEELDATAGSAARRRWQFGGSSTAAGPCGSVVAGAFHTPCICRPPRSVFVDLRRWPVVSDHPGRPFGQPLHFLPGRSTIFRL